MPKNLEDLFVKADMVCSYVKTIHVDVMDGSITHSTNWPFSPEMAKEFQLMTSGEKALPHWDKVDYEVDIMMQNPEDSLAEWINAGFRRLIIHVEATENIGSIIHEWQGIAEIGVAINVDTPLEKLQKALVDGVDFVQFMCISQIGFQGNPFDSRVIQKVTDFHHAHPEVVISVDGGVNEETIPALAKAGATRFVMGSAIYQFAPGKAISDAILHYHDLVLASPI